MKRRVAVVTEIIAPYRIPVFNALASGECIDLHVIFLSETDAYLREWKVYKEEIRFSYEVLPGWRRRIANRNVLLNWGIARSLDKASPQAIICGGYNYLASWQVARWSDRNKVPLLLWSESTDADHRGGHAAVEILKKFFLRKCEACIVPGRSAFDYLAKLSVPQHVIHTAPDAVDNEFFKRVCSCVLSDAAAYRRKLDLPERYFLFAGRLVKEKGVFDLLDAYASLDPELRSNVALVFAGNGAARAELERKATAIDPGRVHFTGFLHRRELGAVYALADMLVFPTHTDPWGLVVNEAMSCGLPIIATSVAGCTADLVEPGRNGLIIPPSDVARLASAMTLLACDPELRKSMGAHSSEKIGQFSPEACADALARAASLVSGSARYV